MDSISKAHRSWNMSRIRGKDTRPEMMVRSHLHRVGFRFRVNRADLPGKPDIVLPKYKLAILVHGCYWHRHPSCKQCSVPKSNVPFWTKKFERNVARDFEVKEQLGALGWRTFVIWECEASKPEVLAKRLQIALQLPQMKKPTGQGSKGSIMNR